MDMRGEVVLLSRNVQIEGEDVDSWGGSVLTTQLRDGGDNLLSGSLTWDNVQVRKCSQRDTHRAAVRFEGAAERESKISNSVVHDGLAWLLYIANSYHVDVKDSSFIGARAVGVNLHTVGDVHLDNVFVADV